MNQNVFKFHMDQETVIKQLKWSIQVLALEANEQVSCFPEFVVVTDELLLDFDNWYEVALCNFQEFFNQDQQTALKELYLHLDSYTVQEQFTSNIEELKQSNFWIILRARSKSVLSIMGWEEAKPGNGRTQ